ncbi:MAG: hypothetical protein ABRQ24_00140 [Syntrophomonadaceae bacterium]
MKKVITLLLVLLLSLSLLGCSPAKNTPPAQNNPAPTGEQEQQQVRSVVTTFGQRLQMVSLTAAPEQVLQQMQANYADLVTPELLAKWQNQPNSAPGRAVSSPWPERIDVTSLEKTDGKYAVKGEIIWITSVEKTNGGAAARQSIDLTVAKPGDRWLIDSVILGTQHKEGTILYQNAEYGFDFILPTSWQGYKIITEEWEGTAITGPSQGKIISRGPKLSIRHPQWTQAQPRQDIPILVFTLDQWDSLQRQTFSIGAAPIGPKELGRNSKYVFALPARYNFAFPAGFEEVENILAGQPLQPK